VKLAPDAILAVVQRRPADMGAGRGFILKLHRSIAVHVTGASCPSFFALAFVLMASHYAATATAGAAAAEQRRLQAQWLPQPLRICTEGMARDLSWLSFSG